MNLMVGQKKVSLFYRTGKNYIIETSKKNKSNSFLKVISDNDMYTPSQIMNGRDVSIKADSFFDKQGFYKIIGKSDTLTVVSYNYPYKESSSEFLDLNKISVKSTYTDSLDVVLDSVNSKIKLISYWRLFLSLCIVSLLLEIFLIKYYKI